MSSLRVPGLAGSLLAVLSLPLAPQGDACEAMIGTEYSDPPEVISLALDPEDWHIVFRARDEGSARKEWVRADQTLTQWEEIVTWRIRFGPNPYPLEQVKESFLRTISYVCPEVKQKVVFKSETEILFEWWHDECYNREPQYHVSRVVDALTGTHTLGYGRKGALPTQEVRERWLSRLRESQPRIDRLPEGPRGPIDQARLAIWAADYPTALKSLEPLAKKGDPEAQAELAGLYFEGWGVPEDQSRAAELYRQAATQDHASSHYSLGRMYENGWGVDTDPETARKWYTSAAELGDPEAQGRLGYLLANDSKPDYATASQWLQKAADAGHYHALFWLGRIQEEGWGLEEPNLPKALALYREIAVLGEPDAQYRLGLAYRDGQGVAKDPALAAHWVERAAAQGSAEARKLYVEEYASKGR